MEKIGLIPAAGYARRLGNIHGSKEMMPVIGEFGEEPICHSLIRQFETAAINKIVLVTRQDKTDLLKHVESTLDFNVEITIIKLEETRSTLETICAAYELIRGKEVYLGFPDMIVSPADAISTLSDVKDSSSADAVLGAFPTNDSGKVDMIDIGANNQLIDIVIKNPECCYKYAWILACWNKNFTDYLYNSFHSGKLRHIEREIFIGDILLSFLKDGYSIEVRRISGGEYIDIGTPEDLVNQLLK